MSVNEEFRPKIVAFCCNWCSYAGADLAGSSRLAYPADVKIIRVPCSCRVCVRVSVCLSVCLPVACLLSQEGRGLGVGSKGGLGSAKGRG